MTTRAIVAFPVLLLAAAGAHGATVNVDCAAGASINAAIAAAPVTEALVVEVRGICVENVVIERSDVTLRGLDPAADGVRAVAATLGNRAVHVRKGARSVVLQNLRLGDSFVGLTATEDSGVTVSNGRLSDNGAWGAEAGDESHVTFIDTTISGNNLGGLWIGGEGSIRCERCTIANNLDPAGSWTYNVSLQGGSASLTDSSVAGADYGLFVSWESTASLLRTSVAAARNTIRQFGSRVVMSGGTLDGVFWVEHGQLTLVGVTQTAGTGSNGVYYDSFARFDRWGAVPSTIPRAMSVQRFSNAVSTGTSFGTLSCGSGGNFWCDSATTKTSSSCGLCP